MRDLHWINYYRKCKQLFKFDAIKILYYNCCGTLRNIAYKTRNSYWI